MRSLDRATFEIALIRAPPRPRSAKIRIAASRMFWRMMPPFTCFGRPRGAAAGAEDLRTEAGAVGLLAALTSVFALPRTLDSLGMAGFFATSAALLIAQRIFYALPQL